MKKRRVIQRGGNGAKARKAGSSLAGTVAELGRRFAAFRAKHKPYTRIPLVLQTAVAKAHSRGATEMELRDACGISAAQFQRWTSSVSLPIPRRAKS